MLRPFNSRKEVNMLRRAAYSRYKPIHSVDVVINERLYLCRHIINIANISEAIISNLHLTLRVVHFENMTFEDQVSSLRATNVLISMHGAGLSNIIFLQPGSTVIEILHPLLKAPFYRFLSLYASVNYIPIRDVIPLNDSCCNQLKWNPYLSMNLIVNEMAVIDAIVNL